MGPPQGMLFVGLLGGPFGGLGRRRTRTDSQTSLIRANPTPTRTPPFASPPTQLFQTVLLTKLLSDFDPNSYHIKYLNS